MILADTSVWVDHLRFGDPQLSVELNRNAILMHSFVSGELALGSLPQRSKVLREIDSLPVARVARVEEVRALIERQSLFSRGIGYIDAHLLAAVLLTPHTLLWTRDKRLRIVAELLGIHAPLN
jgi:predicted nucleic acid-binding protein